MFSNKYFNPKVDVIARLDFEVTYEDFSVQHFSYTTELPFYVYS